MTIIEAQQHLKNQLLPIYGERESGLIADWVIEKITGLKRIERLVNKQQVLLADQYAIFQKHAQLLLEHVPVQYVLNEAYFAGMKLFVDRNVLIPRPETEELVEWAINDLKNETRSKGLDIGTGSGCIALAIKKTIPMVQMHACDISVQALQVARQNGAAQSLPIQFHHLDILDEKEWLSLPAIDFIISNPPYVPLKDMATMQPHVLQHEPHLALFVHNNNPLEFYNAIAALGMKKLNQGGRIYVEIHESLGNEAVKLFTEQGYSNVELKKDMQGKDRMVKAEL